MTRLRTSSLCLMLLCVGCASLGTSSCQRRQPPGTCEHSGTDAWQAVCTALDESPLLNAVVVLGDEEDRRFTWSRGIDDSTTLRLASASKWLTALTLMRLVEAGTLALDTRLSDHVRWATEDENDPRSRITLGHLLSFTAGFDLRPISISCVNDGDTTLEACARELYEQHHADEPGTVYFYGPAPMHLAAHLAADVTGVAWPALFRREVADPLNLSAEAAFALPSTTNPRASGGGQATTADYERVLTALLGGTFAAASLEVMHRDWTPAPEVTIAYSPATDFGLEWHYGLGNWLECDTASWTASCEASQVRSSPGAYGFHPWIDYERRIYGIVGREDGFLRKPAQTSAELMIALRPLIHEAMDR